MTEPGGPGREFPRINHAKTPAEDCRLWAVTKRRREPRLRGETLPRGVWRETSAVGFVISARAQRTAGPGRRPSRCHDGANARSRGTVRLALLPNSVVDGLRALHPRPPRWKPQPRRGPSAPHLNARLTPRGPRLLADRIASGWTITRAAGAAGISRQTGSKWWRRARRRGGDAGLPGQDVRPYPAARAGGRTVPRPSWGRVGWPVEALRSSDRRIRQHFQDRPRCRSWWTRSYRVPERNRE